MTFDWKKTKIHLRWATTGRYRFGVEKAVKHPRRFEVMRDHDLWFIWAGRGRLLGRMGEVSLAPGVCLWLRPGWKYETLQDDRAPLGMMFVHFDLVDEQGRPRHILEEDFPPEQLIVEDFQMVESLLAWVVRVCQRRQAGVCHAAEQMASATVLFRGLLMQLDAFTRCAGKRRQAFDHAGTQVVSRICHLLQEKSADPPLVSHLARQAGYTRQHLTRLFRNVTGLSLKQYLTAMRMAHARQLLRNSELTIQAVAQAAGYKDPFHFSRQFKMATGQSPSAFSRFR
ncbi:MAG: AraC family transcriptional regulator [Verrucomicrobiae bacterium]|nr:AraC family transcriptional regulator [Verrucomicrobiae bacterium]